jgi:hypothetical protein
MTEAGGIRRPVSGRDAVRTQVIDVLEAQVKKETGNKQAWHCSQAADGKFSPFAPECRIAPVAGNNEIQPYICEEHSNAFHDVRVGKSLGTYQVRYPDLKGLRRDQSDLARTTSHGLRRS